MGEDLLVSKEGMKAVQAAEPKKFNSIGSEDKDAMRIYLQYGLFRSLDKFALESSASQRTALLLGTCAKDGSWIRAENKIELDFKDSKNKELSEQVWKNAYLRAKEEFPGKTVIGWFHSHPGSGLNLSDFELSVHKKFFPEKYQVVYITNPVVGQRGFHYYSEGSLKLNGGYRICDAPEKTAAEAREAEPALRAEEYKNERYLERSVEKLQRMVKNPAVRPIDYVILVIASLCLVMQILRPAPAVKVDQRDVLYNQNSISLKIDEVDKHVKALEEHLEDSGIIDRDLVAAAAKDEEKAESASEKKEPKSAAGTAAAVSGDKVIIHTVKAGETISSIANKYYAVSDTKVCRELGKFNKLNAPGYDHIVPGEKLKIPSRQKVGLK